MLSQLNYTVSSEILQQAISSLPAAEFKFTLNQPTTSFFYDNWVIKPELKGSPWETILNSLNGPIGEARIINLKPGTCYHSHADIDDRYHLNLTGDHSYLVDLESNEMFPLVNDQHWYIMNAGKLHSAVNFGAVDRLQIVVRKLLNKSQLINPVKIRIYWEVLNYERARSLLDNHLSGWLNSANKNSIISNFSFTSTDVKFDVENSSIDAIKQLLPEHFKIEYL